MSHSSVSQFVQSRLDDNYYTPDTPPLFRQKYVPLFVYGTLKKGFSRGAYLADEFCVGSGWTRNTGWNLYRVNSATKSYPVMLSCTTDHEGAILTPGAVFGEVYLVSPNTIRNLDFIESNGIQYTRVNRTVDIIQRNSSPRTMACWMYVGVPAHWNKLIHTKGIVPCEITQRKDDPNFKYYIFMKKYDASLRNM